MSTKGANIMKKEKCKEKGSVIITESMLTIGGIVVSLVLLAIVFGAIFAPQTKAVEDTALIKLGRELAVTIDTVAGSASSVQTTYVFPDGVHLNVSMGDKDIKVGYLNATKQKYVSTALTASRNLGHYSNFTDPDKICIVKTRNDARIHITKGDCVCLPNDDKCDPACQVQGICDSKCYVHNNPDDVCDPNCVKSGDGICDPDCYRNKTDMVVDKDCIKSGDGICDPDTNKIKDGICDSDCLSNEKDYFCDPDCSSAAIKDGICDPDCSEDICDGVCDIDCIDIEGVCDPDCGARDPDCMNCAKQGESCEEKPCCGGKICGKRVSADLVCCPGSKTCINPTTETCCGNEWCEISPFIDDLVVDDFSATNPDINITRWEWNSSPLLWENFYTCEDDCGTLDQQTKPNAAETTDNCNSRVNPGTWTSSPCINNGGSDNARLIWYEDRIQVCSQAAIDYLNRRGWDISEIAKDIVNRTPRGFAFQCDRYGFNPDDVCTVQQASTTLEANEGYDLPWPACCSSLECRTTTPGGGECNQDPDTFPKCKGVGFCIDHSTAMISVLRTLGVPAKNVYIMFMIGPYIDDPMQRPMSCRTHATIAYKCDHSLADNMILTIPGTGNRCVNGEWYVIDTTGHFITRMDRMTCGTMCTWWNDKGLYNETVEIGRDYPNDARCYDNPSNPYDWVPDNRYCAAVRVWCDPGSRRR